MAGGTKPPAGALTQEIARILRAQLASNKRSEGGRPSTNRALAAALGVSASYVGDMVNGIIQIDIEMLDRICMLVGLNLTTVITDADAASKRRIYEA